MGMAVLCGFSVLSFAGGEETRKLIDDVNVFVGTDGFGNVYPGPQVPFGGIQISPDCDDKDYDCAAGYKYSKPFIQGSASRTSAEPESRTWAISSSCREPDRRWIRQPTTTTRNGASRVTTE